MDLKAFSPSVTSVHDGIDLLVLAFPRSGSSALRHQLNRFVEVHIPPESAFAVWVADRLTDLEFRRDPERFVAEVLASRKFEHWGLDARDLRACSDAPTVREALIRVYRAHLARHRPQARVLGDKNNSYVFAPERSIEVLAPRTVVLLWRDPAEIWNSFRRLADLRRSPGFEESRYFPVGWEDPRSMIAAWVTAHEAALKAVCRADARSLAVVAHRDFAAAPRRTADGLVSRLLGGPGHRGPVPAALREPAEFAPWKRGVEDESFLPGGSSPSLEELCGDPALVDAVRSLESRLRALSVHPGGA